ncbi:MAG TPA: hypothetical protein VHM70_06540 [Polyangiaceae bacterium]|nr:hypothetical protein [Polyangiaceae bacterium]
MATSELRRVLLESGLRADLHRRIEERLKKHQVELAKRHPDLERKLGQLEVEIANMVAFVRTAKPAAAMAVQDQLEAAVTQKQELEAQLRAQSEHPATPALPSEAQLEELAADVASRLLQDPMSGREMLRRLLGGSPIRVSPQEEGGHSIAAAIFVPTVVRGSKATKQKTPGGSGGPSGSVDHGGCAGWI